MDPALDGAVPGSTLAATAVPGSTPPAEGPERALPSGLPVEALIAPELAAEGSWEARGEPVLGETSEPGGSGDAVDAVAAPKLRPIVDAAGLDALFRDARTVWAWQEQPVPDEILRQVYDLMKLGPTSANCSPARFMFLRTADAKARLRSALSAGNVAKTEGAPVVCIVAYDPRFYEDLPRLYPGVDARAWFAGNDPLATETAFRNGTLQGAYLMMAARAVGLDCAAMSGFDNETVDREFMVAQGWKSNFLVALGHGDRAGLAERAPRLGFDEACRLL